MQVNAGADMTLARTVFDSGDIVLESGNSTIYDNRFINSTLEVVPGVNGAAIYHNVVDNLSWLTDSGTDTLTLVDGWGNVTDPVDTENILSLQLAIPGLVDRTLDAAGNAYVQPADVLFGNIDVEDLQGKIAGLELLLGYNTDLLTAASVALAPDWDTLLVEHTDTSTVIGKLDAAIGKGVGINQ